MQFIELLKDIVNFICDPRVLISLTTIALFASLKWPEKFYSDKSAKVLFGVMIVFFLVSLFDYDFRLIVTKPDNVDRKSTRLNSSHGYISYAVFCLKKKKKKTRH